MTTARGSRLRVRMKFARSALAAGILILLMMPAHAEGASSAPAASISFEKFTESSLKLLTRDALRAFWKAGYTPDNAALVVAGNISPDELRAIAQKYFGAWSGRAQPVVQPRAAQGSDRQLIVEDVGEANQAALRMGGVGASRDSPDLVPLRMLNSSTARFSRAVSPETCASSVAIPTWRAHSSRFVASRGRL